MSGRLWKYEINTAISGYESNNYTAFVCNTHMKQMKNKCVRDVLSSLSSSSSSSLFSIYIVFFLQILPGPTTLCSTVFLRDGSYSTISPWERHLKATPTGPQWPSAGLWDSFETDDVTHKAMSPQASGINQQLQRQPVHSWYTKETRICNAFATHHSASVDSLSALPGRDFLNAPEQIFATGSQQQSHLGRQWLSIESMTPILFCHSNNCKRTCKSHLQNMQ